MTIKEIDRVVVIKRMNAKSLTAVEGGNILGISSRQAKRLLRRFRQEGERGMIGKWKGSCRAHTELEKRVVLETLSSEKYKGFKPTFASEKLRECLGVKAVNRETLRQWMMEAGLWRGKKRSKVVLHQSRARRSRFGELIQLDGSPHDWFEGRCPKCSLLVFIDDATSRIMYMRFEPAETTLGYFRCVKEYILQHGYPVAFYSDKYGVFTVNKKNIESTERGITQFQRAMNELKIDMILANSPQAKGRVERANQTMQDRLIKEMRLRNINDMEQANAWLPEYIKMHNDKFAQEPAVATDAHRPVDSAHAHIVREQLDTILSKQTTRKLSKNLELQHNGTIYQIKQPGIGYGLRNATVTVCERMDGTITIHKGVQTLKYETINALLHKPQVVDRKEVNALLDKKIIRRFLDRTISTTTAVPMAA